MDIVMSLTVQRFQEISRDFWHLHGHFVVKLEHNLCIKSKIYPVKSILVKSKYFVRTELDNKVTEFYTYDDIPIKND